jgi:hypothetical protein
MLARMTSFLLKKLSEKSQQASLYFDKTQTDEATWKLRMINFRSWISIILIIILFFLFFKH